MSEKSSPTHTVLRPFHAEESNRVVHPSEPFTPASGPRGVALMNRKLIAEGYKAKAKAPANDKNAPPHATKPAPQGSNKGNNPPPPPPPAK